MILFAAIHSSKYSSKRPHYSVSYSFSEDAAYSAMTILQKYTNALLKTDPAVLRLIRDLVRS